MLKIIQKPKENEATKNKNPQLVVRTDIRSGDCLYACLPPPYGCRYLCT